MKQELLTRNRFPRDAIWLEK